MHKKILVIDDSPVLRQVVNFTLTSAGYDVVEAEDGQQALEKLDGTRFHLAICDVNMPVMDGLAFIRSVKTNPKHRFLPIIMLTTEASESRKQEGQALGAKAWIVKPFRPDQMLNAVSKLILH